MEQTDKAKPKRAPRGSLLNKRAAAYREAHNMVDPLRLMKVGEVAAMLQVHPQTIWNWSSRGKLPKPIKLGPQIVCWRASEIAKWLDAKAAETAKAATETAAENSCGEDTVDA